MLTWIRSHKALMAWLGGASILMFVAGLVLVPLFIARMPADHFVRTKPRPETWRGRHPVVRLTLRVLKNVLGGLLVLAGIAMLVLPGQGILTILVGLLLLDLPGERRIEVTILRQPAVRRATDWLRRRAGRPPLLLPPEQTSS